MQSDDRYAALGREMRAAAAASNPPGLDGAADWQLGNHYLTRLRAQNGPTIRAWVGSHMPHLQGRDGPRVPLTAVADWLAAQPEATRNTVWRSYLGTDLPRILAPGRLASSMQRPPEGYDRTPDGSVLPQSPTDTAGAQALNKAQRELRDPVSRLTGGSASNAGYPHQPGATGQSRSGPTARGRRIPPRALST